MLLFESDVPERRETGVTWRYLHLCDVTCVMHRNVRYAALRRLSIFMHDYACIHISVRAHTHAMSARRWIWLVTARHFALSLPR